MIYAGLLATLLIGRTASNLTIGDPSVAFAPPHILVVGNGLSGEAQKEIFRVEPDGRIVLGPGASLDDASLAFWRVVDRLNPGMCREIIKERNRPTR